MNTILGTINMHRVMQELETAINDSLIGTFAIITFIMAVVLSITAVAFVASDKPWNSMAKKIVVAIAAMLGAILCTVLGAGAILIWNQLAN